MALDYYAHNLQVQPEEFEQLVDVVGSPVFCSGGGDGGIELILVCFGNFLIVHIIIFRQG